MEKASEKAASEPLNYAVIRTGGKQYSVSPGQNLSIGKLDGKVGDKISFGEVLLVRSSDSTGPKVGTPVIAGASVSAVITEQFLDKKVIIFKKKRRKGYTKKQGHRQELTRVRIEAIQG